MYLIYFHINKPSLRGIGGRVATTNINEVKRYEIVFINSVYSVMKVKLWRFFLFS